MSFTYTDYHYHQFDRQFFLPPTMPSPTSCWYPQRQDVQFGYSYPDPEYTLPLQIAQPHPPTCWDNPWQPPQQYQQPPYQPFQPPSPPVQPPRYTPELEPNLSMAVLVSQLERLTADVEQLVSRMDANKRCPVDPHAAIQPPPAPPLSITYTTSVLYPLQQPTIASPVVLHRAPHQVSMPYSPNLSPYSAAPYAVQSLVTLDITGSLQQPHHCRKQLARPCTRDATHIAQPLASIAKLESRLDDTDRHVGELHAQPLPPPAPPNGQLSGSHIGPFLELQSQQVVIVKEKVFGLHRYSIDEYMKLNGNCGEGDTGNSYSRCLLNKYDEETEVVYAFGEWSCPKCIGICNCIVCITKKKKGNKPTNIFIDTTKKIDLPFVFEMLFKGAQYLRCEKVAGMIVASPQKEVAPSFRKRGKENSFNGKLDLKLPDDTNEMERIWEAISVVNLSELFANFTNYGICREALGRKYGNGEEFKMEELGVLLDNFDVGEFVPWIYWITFVNGIRGRVRRVARNIDEFLEFVVREQIGEKKEGEKDFVDVLFEGPRNERCAFVRDDISIKAIILDVFATGSDTMFTLIEWRLSEFILHKKAKNEFFFTVDVLPLHQRCASREHLHAIDPGGDNSPKILFTTVFILCWFPP